MKILLTGHKGFIGSHMFTALENAGHLIDTYEWGDKQLPSVVEQDWVIHIGAISATTEKDIEKVLTQNLDFSVKLYNECKMHGVNFQYSSSASVYGLNREFTEESKLDPRTPYAWSKYLFERYVRKHPSKSITQGFRYFNVYGSGEEHKGGQASPQTQFSKQAKETGKIKVFHNSDKYLRDFIPVEDVVNYHLKFLDCKESGIFNIGTGKTKSFLDIASDIALVYNAEIMEIPMPEILKNSYQEYTCADMSRVNQLTK
jgi:ADP-L-glycero-D-manno-heptose 6-epimerase